MGDLRLPKMQTCIICAAVQMVEAELRYNYIMRSFLIDDGRITEFCSRYNINFVEHVRSTSPEIALVDEELSADQAWKKSQSS
ncbi:hypothetical protein TNCV_4644661 [Trichonephila clavipes]|nr:hypothetical protein TNCV_4644661 [Trichonephila clavipes]